MSAPTTFHRNRIEKFYKLIHDVMKHQESNKERHSQVFGEKYALAVQGEIEAYRFVLMKLEEEFQIEKKDLPN